MLALVAVHDNATLGLKFPCSLVYVEYDDIHAEVACRLLRREARAQRVVEKDEETGLVVTQSLILITVFLNLKCFGESLIEVAEVKNVCVCLHIYILLKELMELK